MNRASDQELHQDQLRSSLWKSSNDMELALISEYLDDLGATAQCSDRSTLANMCICVLEGSNKHQLKARVVATILWQEEQILRVDELFEYLICHAYIAYYLTYDEAKKALADNREDVWGMMRSLFEVTEASEGLQSPQFEDGYITVHFPDAFEHLVYLLTFNKLIQPKSFNLGAIQSAIADFLRNY